MFTRKPPGKRRGPLPDARRTAAPSPCAVRHTGATSAVRALRTTCTAVPPPHGHQQEEPPMKLRSVLTALALVLGALFAPGVGVLASAGEAHAVTKISHATATSMSGPPGSPGPRPAAAPTATSRPARPSTSSTSPPPRAPRPSGAPAAAPSTSPAAPRPGTRAARTPTGTATSWTSASTPASGTTSRTPSPTSACAATEPRSGGPARATSTPTRATTGT